MDEAFLREMSDGYALDEPSLILGRPMLGGEVAPGVPVQLPLSMVNRHGLVPEAEPLLPSRVGRVGAGSEGSA